ncbi:glycoside hydrolase family 2 protein [Micromonospora sp. NPDC047670]|uniref:glycoside hydrolase family 2 protein n=1 Tax=Micromonospora sp. NPDC047670 TaxID=3364252 RepID=UPI0037231C52
MSAYHPLHEGWTVTATSSGRDISAVPASVPGCVHTDLLAAGLIDDPYRDDNERRLAWIGHETWRYETTFDWSDDGSERTDLCCEGLDTVATVRLNGVEVGTSANMHRSYRFPIGSVLREGVNTLAITFDSAYAYAEANRERMGDRPGPYPQPYQFIRKMACNFGWDWGPTLVTAGIWRPIGVHSWSTARLAQVRPIVTLDGADADVRVHVGVERAGEAPLTVTATVADASGELTLPPGVTEGVLTLRVTRPERWWPRGYGDQPLYPLTVTLADTGEVWRRDIGFRSVALDTSPDGDGTRFTLLVNDVPVLVKGANWIPDDCFPARLTSDRIAERLDQACAANINLLRVWGGGLYESRDFYEAADRRGLLVLQDFPFACAAYPEDEPLTGEVRAEAREQVARLTPHPSLVMWLGNNENFLGHADWGWQQPLDGRSWGAGYYLDLLPTVVSELDPSRPYWPGTPYSGDPAIHPNDPTRGTVHVWDVWNEIDYTAYARWRPRFVAEFGFQGPATFPTLRRAITGPLAPDSPALLHHQKAVDGDAKLRRGLGDHLPVPDSFDDWHYLTQLNQARAVTFGIEHFRSLAPYCSGSIVWQLNDCWPVISWAAIDGDGRRKPLWYALRRAFADRLLTIQPRDGALVVSALNDNAEPWRGQLTVSRLSLAGTPLAKESVDVTVPARGNLAVALPHTVYTPARAAGELLLAQLGEARAVRMFAEDTEVDYPPAEFHAAVTPVPGGYDVTVTAHTIVRELALFPDRLDPDATVDDMLTTLLPGESVTIRVSSDRRLDAAALTAHPVLRCVNEERERR